HEVEDGEVKFLAGRNELEAWRAISIAPLYGPNIQNKPDNWQNHAELQYNAGWLDGALDITSGLYYFKSSINELSYSYSYGGPQLNQAGIAVDTESASIYGQGTY